MALRLLSADAVVIKISAAAAKLCGVLSRWSAATAESSEEEEEEEGVDGGKGGEEEDTETPLVPLPRVSSDDLRLIVRILEQWAAAPPPAACGFVNHGPVTAPLRQKLHRVHTPGWLADIVVQLPMRRLTSLARTAEWLDIALLQNVLCALFAAMLDGVNMSDYAFLFPGFRPQTPDEELYTRVVNEWADMAPTQEQLDASVRDVDASVRDVDASMWDEL